MGGRLDATNVLRPLVTAITPVGLDHERFLGTTIAQIAGEKAGIIKRGVPVVVGRQTEPALDTIRNAANVASATLIEFSPPEQVRAKAFGRYSFKISYRGQPVTLEPGLLGTHQADNAAVVVRIAEQLSEAGFEISAEQLQRGISNARWPGRLEIVSTNPEIILDGAHNPLAARVLASFIQRYMRDRPKPVLIYGSMRDKAIAEVAEILFPEAEMVIATAPSHARSARPQAIAELAAATLGDRAPVVITADDLTSALDQAIRAVSPRRAIFVTGSLYLVGEARQLLLKKTAASAR
jgi:dihydrofolate synthase/folylpolyglutamate synthase